MGGVGKTATFHATFRTDEGRLGHFQLLLQGFENIRIENKIVVTRSDRDHE